MNIIQRHESQVRGYCRNFPAMFDRAEGAYLITEDGKRYLDFFAGAGVLNYGHNHPALKRALLDYIERDGIVHSLDMFSTAKRDFLARFNEIILEPRGLNYKVQFPGPTGTNAVEAALKLARKVTGRERILSFTNAFHGMTLGALAVTGNAFKRAGAGVPLSNVSRMPFDGYLGENSDSLTFLERVLDDAGSGVDKPAAVILETVQAEGGVNVASFDWLKRLANIVQQRGVLLIVDDIQVGCGRTGPFFSFEPAGIKPDMITLSKSLSGYGLPFAVTLMKPEHDQWEPGEHNGTFRGHNLAFVTAAAALEFWRDENLSNAVTHKAKIVSERLQAIAKRLEDNAATVRGRGLIQGLAAEPGIAQAVSKQAFEHGLIVETAGVDSQVLKLLPTLTVDDADLVRGLDIIEESVQAVVSGRAGKRARQVA
jgi:diaminobutyrate-2-oxoglutarate transaminase